MGLYDFLIQNPQIKISDKIRKVCLEGEEVMKKSVDPHHSIKHIDRMLDDLNMFLHTQMPIPHINYEVLLPAIIWHDSWRSTRRVIDGVFSYLYGELADGVMGAKMFKKAAATLNINKSTASRILHCIRIHSTFPDKLPRSLEKYLYSVPIEAQVLRDLDHLDQWHLQRLKDLIDGYLPSMKITKMHLIVGKVWYKILDSETGERYYFDACKNEFMKRKPHMMNAIQNLWDSRAKYGVS